MSDAPDATNGPSGSGGSAPSGDGDERAVLKAVLDALRNIEFGSVLIKIHQGKVAGIETSTKVRLDP
jgi:hypothetical protein